MRTEELVDAMERTTVVGPVDLERITRQGRRLVVRRRAAGAGVALACAVVVAASIALWPATGGGRHAQPAVGRQATLTPAHPGGAVADTDDKFYWGSAHSASLGPEAIWVEAGDPAYRVSFGFHDEATGKLMRAGAMTVPSRTGEHVELPALPRQTEPTYVGMYRLPGGRSASDYSVAVEGGPASEDVHVHQSGTVLPGYVVFWMTSTRDLASGHAWWGVEYGHGSDTSDADVSGTFQPQPQVPGDAR